ncbi:hypothetical protein ACFW04_013631 [Cataglyphis niger]
MLRNTQSTQTIFDYINDFSVLQLSTGYILLLSDFNKLYSDYDLHMWSKWPSFPQKICTLLKLKDESDLVIFMSLGNLFTPTPVQSYTKQQPLIDPNAQEVLDGFILHIKVNNDLAPSIERIILRAQRMKYKVQPIIIAVGATLAECKDFYVVIDKNYYHFNDCKTAVDNETIWYFLQHDLYQLKTSWDKIIPQVSKELKKLENIME